MTPKMRYLTFLIQHGGVTDFDEYEYPNGRFEPKIEYYGSTLSYDAATTKAALKTLRDHGVDEESSGEAQEYTSYHFAGTFTEHQDTHEHTHAMIVYGNGERNLWGVTLGKERANIPTIIAAMEEVGTLEEAIKACYARASKPHFEYGCKYIPPREQNTQDKVGNKWYVQLEKS